MPVIPGVDLSKTQTRCAKKKCRTKDFVLHRHHKGHQYLFVSMFVWRFGQAKYMEFVKRYYEYRDEDVVSICSKHHREIHERYDKVIAAYTKKRRKALRDFSWIEAEDLMNQLIARCNRWLGTQTKGSNTPWPSNGRTKRRAEQFIEFVAQHEEDIADVLDETDLLGTPF